MYDIKSLPVAVGAVALLLLAAVNIGSYGPGAGRMARESVASVGGVLAQTDFDVPMWSEPYLDGTLNGSAFTQQYSDYPTYSEYPSSQDTCGGYSCGYDDVYDDPYDDPYDDVYDYDDPYDYDDVYEIYDNEYVTYDTYGYPTYQTSSYNYSGGTVVQSILQGAPYIVGASVPAISQSPQSAPPSCTITARPSSVAYGGSTVISWASAHATRASLSHVGTVALSGSRTIPNLGESTDFDLSVSGPAGSNWCRASVYVAPRRETGGAIPTVSFSAVPIGTPTGGVVGAPTDVYYYQAPPSYGGTVYVQGAPSVRYRMPSCYISTYPQEVQEGEMVNLMWSSSDATSAYLSDMGPVGTAGTTQFAPRNGSYVLSVTGPGGASTCTTNVVVHARPTPAPQPSAPAAPTCSVTADPASVFAGGSTKLSWTVTRATSIALSDVGSVKAKDSRTVSPTKTQTYTITAKGDGGTKTCSVTVKVQDPSDCKVICNGVTYACAPVGTPVSPICPSTDTAYASTSSGVQQNVNTGTSKGGLWNWIVNLFR